MLTTFSTGCQFTALMVLLVMNSVFPKTAHAASPHCTVYEDSKSQAPLGQREIQALAEKNYQVARTANMSSLLDSKVIYRHPQMPLELKAMKKEFDGLSFQGMSEVGSERCDSYEALVSAEGIEADLQAEITCGERTSARLILIEKLEPCDPMIAQRLDSQHLIHFAESISSVVQ